MEETGSCACCVRMRTPSISMLLSVTVVADWLIDMFGRVEEVATQGLQPGNGSLIFSLCCGPIWQEEIACRERIGVARLKTPSAAFSEHQGTPTVLRKFCRVSVPAFVVGPTSKISPWPPVSGSQSGTCRPF
ncbi:hypothetical protein PoB_003008500 [Plakobranchus ocellatus]|uniref:Uncharacterized protein n=1 Tax=Plakobranchus ocellatus TaxID=259542 RepID=A0AAV4A5Z5_9GAST|nr:hypothetical protein PoB_003008500 [Plakobranchus ocellatus]